MNSVNLLGRLTRNVEVRYSNDLAIGRFSVAINRPKNKDGNSGADFINVVVFGKRAEVIEKYFHKGSQIAVMGHIHTGSYEDKNGNRRYTFDVVLDGFDFVDKKSDAPASEEYDGFEAIDDDDIPF